MMRDFRKCFQMILAAGVIGTVLIGGAANADASELSGEELPALDCPFPDVGDEQDEELPDEELPDEEFPDEEIPDELEDPAILLVENPCDEGGLEILCSAGTYTVSCEYSEWEVPMGEFCTFLVTPNPGYAVDALLVDGVSAEADGEGSYSVFADREMMEICVSYRESGEAEDPEPEDNVPDTQMNRNFRGNEADAASEGPDMFSASDISYDVTVTYEEKEPENHMDLFLPDGEERETADETEKTDFLPDHAPGFSAENIGSYEPAAVSAVRTENTAPVEAPKEPNSDAVAADFDSVKTYTSSGTEEDPDEPEEIPEITDEAPEMDEAGLTVGAAEAEETAETSAMLLKREDAAEPAKAAVPELMENSEPVCGRDLLIVLCLGALLAGACTRAVGKR